METKNRIRVLVSGMAFVVLQLTSIPSHSMEKVVGALEMMQTYLSQIQSGSEPARPCQYFIVEGWLSRISQIESYRSDIRNARFLDSIKELKASVDTLNKLYKGQFTSVCRDAMRQLNLDRISSDINIDNMKSKGREFVDQISKCERRDYVNLVRKTFPQAMEGSSMVRLFDGYGESRSLSVSPPQLIQYLNEGYRVTKPMD